ncbi:MAG: ribonuclease HII [Firmicutes bacterium]|nr:ribonuclease HII [Bacillota bacterium]
MDIKSLTVDQVKKLVQKEGGPAGELLGAMAADSRAGIRAIYARCLQNKAREQAENKRLQEMFLWESRLRKPWQRLVAGTDEAGRGPLAGPVVAAAVILAPDLQLRDLNDSKKLTPAKRESLEVAIKAGAVSWAVGMATVDEIELYNIHQASLLAMQRAINDLRLSPDLILVDGRFTIPRLAVEQQPITGGDGLCPSIAAASILAKVARDRLMDELHLIYPQYGFDRHRGYPTPYHLTAIAAHGPCPVHRRGFMPLRQLAD